MATAVYPGSFDPVTLGHLNIITRAAQVFDEVYVCTLVNSGKAPLFTRDERVELIQRCTAKLGNVYVEAWDDLVVKYVKKCNARIIVKGLRAVSDFDREFQMALVNKINDDDIETLFMASAAKYTYLSSTVVKEMARYGADISEFVPREIIDDVYERVERFKRQAGD